MQIFPRLEGRFADFVAPARDRSDLWRLGLSSLLIAAAFVAGAFVTAGLFYVIVGAEFDSRIMASGSLGRTPLSIIFVLSGFPVIFLAVWAAARLIHRRSLGTVFGAARRDVLRNAALATMIVTLITGLSTIYSFITSDPEPNLPLGTWLGWMVPVLPLLLIQVTTEELIFRGYLQQQLAARFNSPWIWMVLPSAVFGSLHFQPGVLGANAWIAVLVTTLIGVFAADITARTGNIGAAIGLHFVNNFFAMCFLSLDGAMSGVSLFVTRISVADSSVLRPLLLTDAGTIAAAYAIYLIIVNRFCRP